EYQAQMERRWEEQRAEWERRWEDFLNRYEQRWKDFLNRYEQRWEKHHAESEERFRKMLQRVDTGISAIGARWGIFAESAFRNGIQAILEESFGVQVLHYQGYDPNGEIFGHPDQVELDLIIKDGLLIICEIKSSMSRSDMYTFERKVRFYERQEGRQAHRRIVISPMVEEKALQVAQKLGIEVYSHADDVSL
ncbi:MAG: PD-(D/E)XK nuclease family protein, partial [Anaerolineae bacterium]